MNLSIGDLTGQRAGWGALDHVGEVAAHAVHLARLRGLSIGELVGNVRRRITHGVQRLTRAVRRLGDVRSAVRALTVPRGPPVVI